MTIEQNKMSTEGSFYFSPNEGKNKQTETKIHLASTGIKKKVRESTSKSEGKT
jgi:hypothetical protein